MFNFIGKLFAGNLIHAEVQKVHDDIETEMKKALSGIGPEIKDQLVPALTDIAKQAAIAAVQAYIQSQIQK